MDTDFYKKWLRKAFAFVVLNAKYLYVDVASKWVSGKLYMVIS